MNLFGEMGKETHFLRYCILLVRFELTGKDIKFGGHTALGMLLSGDLQFQFPHPQP